MSNLRNSIENHGLVSLTLVAALPATAVLLCTGQGDLNLAYKLFIAAILVAFFLVFSILVILIDSREKYCQEYDGIEHHLDKCIDRIICTSGESRLNKFILRKVIYAFSASKYLIYINRVKMPFLDVEPSEFLEGIWIEDVSEIDSSVELIQYATTRFIESIHTSVEYGFWGRRLNAIGYIRNKLYGSREGCCKDE